METEIDGDNPFAQCDIVFRDETRLRVEVTNDANHYDDARSNTEPFWRRFSTNSGRSGVPGFDFIYGGPSAPGRTIQIAVSAAFTAAFIGSDNLFSYFRRTCGEDNNWLLIPLALLMGSLCAGLLYLSIKNRQTPFEPLAIPEMLLPMLKAKRKA